MPAPASIDETFVVMRPDLHAESIAVTDTLYTELDRRFEGFRKHLLISSHRFDCDWPSWECHPHGDEFVCLLSGAVQFLLRDGDADQTFDLRVPGSFVIVPANTWHTALVHKAAQLLFVTPGEGTQNTEEPPA